MKDLLKGWSDCPEPGGKGPKNAVAGIVPHAGWFFSGRLSFDVFSSFPREVGTVVVIGGHLPENGGIVAAFEEGYETPLGAIEADFALLSYIKERLPLREDRNQDNTVEVQLPLIKYLFPDSKTLWLRAAPSEVAITLGQVLAGYRNTENSIVVVGSTDLTHYGSSYGFSPKGSGAAAADWVRNVNDKSFIEALLSQDAKRALALARKNRAACSAGGAAAASAFALSLGIHNGRLLRYSTSLEAHDSESFVGYAGIVYEYSTCI